VTVVAEWTCTSGRMPPDTDNPAGRRPFEGEGLPKPDC
jgi:hypothetical protein